MRSSEGLRAGGNQHVDEKRHEGRYKDRFYRSHDHQFQRKSKHKCCCLCKQRNLVANSSFLFAS